MHEEKTAVKVKSEDDRKLVIETAEGKEETYYLNPIRTMYLRVEQLQVVKSFSSHDGWAFWHRVLRDQGAPEPPMEPAPELTAAVSGTAVLEAGRIGIIGAPGSKARVFRIAIMPGDEGEQDARDKWAQEHGKQPFGQLTTVGFTRHDWEIGNDDEWFIQCEVSAGTMETIASAVSSGALREARIGLQLRDIYTDDDWSPPSCSTDWFLRPSKGDNSIDSPESAYGAVSSLVLALEAIDLRPQAEAVPESCEDAPTEVEPHPTVAGLAAVGAGIKSLRDTVKWVGGLIALALLMLAFK